MSIIYKPTNFQHFPIMRWTCWHWRWHRCARLASIFPEAELYRLTVSRSSLSKTYGTVVLTLAWSSVLRACLRDISTACLKRKGLHWCAMFGSADWRIAGRICWIHFMQAINYPASLFVGDLTMQHISAVRSNSSLVVLPENLDAIKFKGTIRGEVRGWCAVYQLRKSRFLIGAGGWLILQPNLKHFLHG